MTSTFTPRGAAGYDAYMGRWSQHLGILMSQIHL